MIDFCCPQCGEEMSVPDCLAGQTENCPKCGLLIAVPKDEPIFNVQKDIASTATAQNGPIFELVGDDEPAPQPRKNVMVADPPHSQQIRKQSPDQPRQTVNEAPRAPRSFYAQLATAFIYPFTGIGKWILLAYAVFMTALSLLSFVGLAIGFFMNVYLCPYYMRLITSTAGGEDDPPDWPSLSNIWEDVLRPAMMVAGTWVVCTSVPIAYYSLNLSSGDDTVSFAGSPALLVALIATSALYLPMSMLSVSMHDSLSGLNPLVVIPSIFKVFLPYLIALLALGLVFIVRRSVMHNLPHIPIITGLVAAGGSLYFLMLEMRILGLIYACHCDRLNWFGEANDPRARAREGA